MRGFFVLLLVYFFQPKTPEGAPLPAPALDQVCFFSQAHFAGRSFCVPEGAQEADLVPSGWNDRIVSIHLVGKARVIVYRDVNYRGDKLLLDKSVEDLAELPGNWEQQISSFLAPGEKSPAKK